MVLLAFAACIPEGALFGRNTSGGRGNDVPGLQDTATEGLGDGPSAGFPFDRDEMFDVSLELPQSSVDGLVYEGDYVPGTLRVGDLSTEVGVRLKGASTFDTLDRKPSLKLAFDAFTPDHRFLGFEHLTFNAMKFDPTMLREAAAYRLYDQVGVPSPRHGFAWLTINDQPYGVYSIIETLDNEWLGRVFPDDADGNLYDSSFIYADLTGTGVVNFDLQEGDPATAYADLADLVKALDSGNILDVINTRFDPEATLSYIATDLATGNYDGYSRNTNNFLLYHATMADRWYFVPWGQDTAFRGAGPLYTAVRGRVTAACKADAACKDALENHVRAVFDTWQGEDLYGWTSGMMQIIGPACEEDTRKNEGCDQEDILEAIQSRPEEILGEIGP